MSDLAVVNESTQQLSAWMRPVPALDGLSMMAHLYNRLDGMYPNIFRANFKGGASTYCPNDNRMTIAKRIKALQQLRIAIPAKIHAQAVKMGLGQELGLGTA